MPHLIAENVLPRPWLIFERVLWVGLLLPLGIDSYDWGTHFMLRVGPHHFRWHYLATAILFASLVWRHFRGIGPSGALWQKGLKSPMFWVALALLLSGLIGALAGPYPTRSLVMLAWTMGTVFGVLAMVDGLWPSHGRFMVMTFAIVLGAHMAVLLFDAVVGNWTHGRLHLGFIRMFIHGTVRPSAFRMEPGYYSAWMLVTAILVRGWIAWIPPREKAFRSALWLLWVLALVTAILSTSRMGLAGALVLFALEWALGLVRFLRLGARPRWGLALFGLPLVVLAIVGSLFVARAPDQGVIGYLRDGVLKPHQDTSGQIRWGTVRMAWKLYKYFPIMGTGPGAAGAAAVVYGMLPREAPVEGGLSPRGQPLSNNLYTEILSEWGTVGTLLWLAFGVLLFRPQPWEFRLRWVAALGLIYLTSETLPRYDLWLCLALGYASLRTAVNTRSGARIPGPTSGR